MRNRLVLTALQRILTSIPILIGASILAFLLIHLVPGDPIDVIVNQAGFITPEERAILEEELGLDRPLHIQYLDWLTSILAGDLGYSAVQGRPVADLVANAMWPTIHIGLVAFVFAILFSIPAGVISAVYKDTWIDQINRFFAFGGISVPRFWIGLMLLLVFAEMWNGWFGAPAIATSGWVGLREDPIDWLRHVIAPGIAIGLGYAAFITRITRGAFIDEFNKEYVTTARSKGIRERSLVGIHVFRNALPPILTVTGIQLGFVINGVVVIEEVFGIPGLGRLFYDSIRFRDFPTVQIILVLLVAIFILINLLVDLAYTALDPRTADEEGT